MRCVANVCVCVADNNLDAEAAKHLAPAISQLLQLQTLNLDSKKQGCMMGL